MKLLLILSALTIATATFANESGVGNGGSTVLKNGETILADYFYAARWEPFFIDGEIKEELLKIREITEATGLSFGGDFWDSEIFDPLVEYRLVKRLPVEIVMKIEEVRGIENVRVFGYTEFGEKGRVTWLNKEAFNQLSSMTDKAIAIIHERFHAHFGPQPYEFLTWYTTGLKKLRDFSLGLIPYTPELHSFLHKYTYQAHGALKKNREARTFRAKYVLANDNRCVVFTSKLSGLKDNQLSVKYLNSDEECVGFVTIGKGINAAIDPDNLLELHLPKANGEELELTGIRIRGRGNSVVIDNSYEGVTLPPNLQDSEVAAAMDKIAGLAVFGSDNKIIHPKTQLVIHGNGNQVTDTQLRLTLRGDNNTVLRGKFDKDRAEYRIKITGNGNQTIDSILPIEINGNSNLLEKSQGIVSGNSNQLRNSPATYYKYSVTGNGNSIEYSKADLMIRGDENIVSKVDKSYEAPPFTIIGSRNQVKNSINGGGTIEINGDDNILDKFGLEYAYYYRRPSNTTFASLTINGSGNRATDVNFQEHEKFKLFGDNEYISPMIAGSNNTISNSKVTLVTGSNMNLNNVDDWSIKKD